MKSLSSCVLFVVAGLLAASTARATVTADYGTALSPSGTGYDTGTAPLNPGMTSFTAEAWIYPTGSSSAPVLYQAAASVAGHTGTAGTWLYVSGTTLYSSFNSQKTVALARTPLTANTWQHVAIVYDHVRQALYLYLNGAVTATTYGFVPMTSGHLIIGGDGSSQVFGGYIDEVRVWSTARGPLQIQQDMNLALGGSETGLAAYYNFNDGATSGRVANSKTGFSTISWTGSVSGVLPGANGGAGSLTYAVVKQGTLGTMSVTGSTGQFTYTASGTTTGYDTVTYSVTDGTTTATQTMTVGVGTLTRSFTRVAEQVAPYYGFSGHARLIDLSGDGVLDAYFVDASGYATYYINAGTVYSPSYTYVCANCTPDTVPVPTYAACTGTSSADCVDYYDPTLTGYSETAFVTNPFTGLWNVFLAETSAGTGNNGLLVLYQNSGTTASPSYSASTNNEFGNPPVISNISSMFFADVYGNGLSDAVFVMPGLANPLVPYMSGADTSWSKATSNPLATVTSSSLPSLAPAGAALGDLDGDGVYDLAVAGEPTGSFNDAMYVAYNTGSATSPSFPTYTNSVFDHLTAEFIADVTLADLDGDGWLDVIESGANTSTGGYPYYRNTTSFSVVPTASNVAISGSAYPNGTLTGTYSLSTGSETPAFQWYTVSGTTLTPISGATSQTYTIAGSVAGDDIEFCVTPYQGTQVCSSPVLVENLVWYSGQSQSGTAAGESYTLGGCVNVSLLNLGFTPASLALYGEPTAATYIYMFTGSGCTGTMYTRYTSAGNVHNINLSTVGIGSNLVSYVVSTAPELDLNASISGDLSTGATLTGSYSYESGDGKSDTSTYQWYIASNSSGSGATAISGATSKTFTVPSSDAGLWVSFCAIPESGTLTSGKACSSYEQVLACGGLSSGQSLSSGQAVWSCSNGYELIMQTDGNLVEYNSAGKVLWASNTSGNSGATVSMQGDGNLVIYLNGKALWASNTQGSYGATLSVQGSDGNVVIYLNGKPVWATGT